MKLIGRSKEKEVWFQETNKPYEFITPFDGEDYVCVIFNNAPDVSNEDQNRISDQIVNSGCKYAVCAGHNCSTWDDSIDMAYMATDANFNPPESTFIMTSWHEEESVEDILFHALNCTDFDQHKFKKILVYFIDKDELLKRNIIKKIEKFR